jgi:DUF4097 and DUF4098 domain-containing protein YvlB
MKKLVLIALIAGCSHCFAQGGLEHKEHISKQFTVQNPSANTLAVYNIWGDVKVEGYSGSEVSIEVDETIKADDNEAMERAKSEFKLGFDQKADSIIAYTAAPYDTRPHKRDRGDRNRNEHYIVDLSYTIKVPHDMNIDVQTINDGKVIVKDVYGSLKANNINGPITIENAKGTTNAHTINGDLTVNYLSGPPEDSKYYTLNGKLEVTFPADLSAECELKSMNGGFYTDFPNAEPMPPSVTKTVEKGNNGTTYHLNKMHRVQIGNGGKVLKFETLNGDIYIKKS